MWVIHVKFEKAICHIQIVHELLLEGFPVIKLLFHICEMHTENNKEGKPRL